MNTGRSRLAGSRAGTRSRDGRRRHHGGSLSLRQRSVLILIHLLILSGVRILRLRVRLLRVAALIGRAGRKTVRVAAVGVCTRLALLGGWSSDRVGSLGAASAVCTVDDWLGLGARRADWRLGASVAGRNSNGCSRGRLGCQRRVVRGGGIARIAGGVPPFRLPG